MNGPSCRIRARTHRARPAGATLKLLTLLLSAGAAPANAYWTAAGSGLAAAVTGTLTSPVDVTAPAVAVADVQLSWAAGAGGVAANGDFVTRHHSADAPSAACASSPSTLLVALECTDTAVPEGDYTYVVTTGSDSPHAACRVSDYRVTGSRMPVGRTLEPGGAATFTGASIGFSTTTHNQDACQGASIRVLYTANPG